MVDTSRAMMRAEKLDRMRLVDGMTIAVLTVTYVVSISFTMSLLDWEW